MCALDLWRAGVPALWLSALFTAVVSVPVAASENACIAAGYSSIECPEYRLHATVEEAEVGLDWYMCVYDEVWGVGLADIDTEFPAALNEALATCPDHEASVTALARPSVSFHYLLRAHTPSPALPFHPEDRPPE